MHGWVVSTLSIEIKYIFIWVSTLCVYSIANKLNLWRSATSLVPLLLPRHLELLELLNDRFRNLSEKLEIGNKYT